MDHDYPIVPGRSIVSKTGKELRLLYLKDQKIKLDSLTKCSIAEDEIKNNIESHIGSIEIPVGLVGPILYNENGKNEYVHTAVATLEGALVASMNRGVKCLSLAGGYNAHVIHQKMVRSPMFLFNNIGESIVFKKWTEDNFINIKKIAESFSNHATLLKIEPFVIGKSVQLKFVFRTSDASGQNMTTNCTWHAVLWIKNHFSLNTNVQIQNYIVEGNGASDKKVSYYALNQGRGIHVAAEAFISEECINSVLRTSSTEFLKYFQQSIAMSSLDGMVGQNINVANAVAGIFAATGQDLGSIHESSTGVLNLEKTESGIYVSLNLPSLVIGTVGGGTHLSGQREALEMMGCCGKGKVERFAKLIAGFALGLELSTFAAIVSGQFAISHEKLGRNKPKNWLLKSEITEDFVKNILPVNSSLRSIAVLEDLNVDNGILTNITTKVSKKLIGFLRLQVDDGLVTTNHLIKSKPLDIEVIQGLHFMAANIDVELADLIYEHRMHSEYHNCHLKEIEVYKKLKDLNLSISPEFYGAKIDPKREIYLFITEFLDAEKLQFINSENNPELWSKSIIQKTIKSITTFHQHSIIKEQKDGVFTEFDGSKSIPLYHKLLDLIAKEHKETSIATIANKLKNSDFGAKPELQKTLIHNDFNPRNIAIRKNGSPCIYDWELAVINYPHRDIVELLSFVLPIDFNRKDLMDLLDYHWDLYEQKDQNNWRQGYIYTLKEFLITRASFYLVGNIVVKYDFAERVFLNGARILEILENE